MRRHEHAHPAARPPSISRERLLLASSTVVLLITVLALPVASAADDPGRAPKAGPAAIDDYVLTQAAEGSQTGDNGQGSGISISGGVAAVSSGGKSVYIYTVNSTTRQWVYQTTITDATGGAPGNGSHLWGSAVALDDGLLAVGDQDMNCDIHTRCEGMVQLFTMAAGDPTTWSYWATVHPKVGLSKNKLGSSVALSQHWLVAGAPSRNLLLPSCLVGDATSCGSDEHFVIYDISARGATGSTPSEVAKFDARDFALRQSELGHAVTVAEYANGEAIAWSGAPAKDTVCAARYYTESGASTPSWHHHTCVVSPTDLGNENGFGASVAMAAANNTLVVGSPNSKLRQQGDGDGVAFTYQLSSNGTPPSTFTAGVGAPPGNVDFGASVAIDPGGTYLLVGAPGAGPGSAYGYTANPGGAVYTEEAHFEPSADAKNGSQAGFSVAIGGGAGDFTIGMGAPKQDGTNSQTGYAYFFTAMPVASFSMTVQNPLEHQVISLGATVAATYTLTNTSQVAAQNLVVQQTFNAAPPAGSVSFVPTSGWGVGTGGWTCGPTTCQANDVFPAGSTTTFTASLQVSNVSDPSHLLTQLVWANWSNPTAGAISASTYFIIGPRATATVTLSQQAPTPPAIAAFGEPVTFSGVVTNTSDVPLENPSVNAGVTATASGYSANDTITFGTTDAGWRCLGGTCSAASLPPGAHATFTITAIATDPRTADALTLEATTSLVWSNNVTGTISASASAPVGDILQIVNTGQVPPGQVEDGTTVTWTWTVKNLGDTGAALDAVELFVDPTKLHDPSLTASSSTWTCSVGQQDPGVGGCDAHDDQIGPGGGATFSLTATIHTSESQVKLEPTLIYDTPAFPQVPPLEYTAVTTTVVGPFATPTVTVTGPTGVTPFWAPVTFSIEVHNPGSVVVEQPSVNATLTTAPGPPNQVTITASSGWTCANGVCSAPSLGSGDTATISVTVAAGTDPNAPLQTLTEVAQLQWQNGPAGANSLTAQASADQGPPLLLALSGQTPATVMNGDTVTWTWTLTNQSNQAVDLDALSITADPFALGQPSVSGPPDWTCGVSDWIGYCLTAHALAPASSHSFSLTGTVKTSRSDVEVPVALRYRPPQTADVYDLGIVTTTPVGQQSALAVRSGFSTTVAPTGATASLHITGTNAGTSDAAGVTYAFSVPTGATVESITLPDQTEHDASELTAPAPQKTASGWTCSLAGMATLHCDAPSLARGATHAITLRVHVASTTPASTLTFRSEINATPPDADQSDNVSIAALTVVPTTSVSAPTDGRTAAGTVSGTLPNTGLDGALQVRLLLGAAVLVACGAMLTLLARGRVHPSSPSP